MEQLHSAWGFLFIFGLFAMELGYNAIGLSHRKRRQETDEIQRIAVGPHHAGQRTRQRSRMA